MPTVTGFLQDFGENLLSDYSPELHFLPSGPAVGNVTLYATKPIVVIPNPVNGRFEVDLVQTTDLNPDRWFVIAIAWLDSVTGGYIGKDFLDWKLRVPPEGGQLADLMEAPSNPGRAWVGLTPPPNPTPYTWWLHSNPDNILDPENTGDLYEWEY